LTVRFTTDRTVQRRGFSAAFTGKLKFEFFNEKRNNNANAIRTLT